MFNSDPQLGTPIKPHPSAYGVRGLSGIPRHMFSTPMERGVKKRVNHIADNPGLFPQDDNRMAEGLRSNPLNTNQEFLDNQFVTSFEKVLSGERASKMTKTYHDIDAVMSLLEEKEKDLELAARIGQALLIRNKHAAQEKEVLEERLAQALEEASQLKHDISMKQDLLHAYADNESDVSSTASPVKDYRLFGRAHLQSDIGGLHDRIRQLELDNEELQLEQSLMHDQSANQGEIVGDTVRQLETLQEDLKSANEQIDIMTKQLSTRTENMTRQEERITELLAQIAELQNKHRQLASEHEDLQHHLYSANKSQVELTHEVQDLEERYHEVLNLLDRTNQESRIREESLTSEDFASGIPFHNSLAAELENSGVCFDAAPMFNMSGVGEKSPTHNEEHQKVFETARLVNRMNHQRSPVRVKPCTLDCCTSPTRLKFHIGGIPSSTPSSGLTTPSMGKPGVPGTADLERAIRKLTQRRIERSNLDSSLELNESDPFDPLPPNICSSSSYFMRKRYSAPKLRIVKQLEGSSTLHQWKNLAERTSHPLDLADERTTQGVVLRGCRKNTSLPLSMATDTHLNSSLEVNTSTTDTSNLPGGILRKGILKVGSAPPSGGIFTFPTSPLPIPNKKQRTDHEDSGIHLGTSPIFRTVKSSPHLVGLAAALLPPDGLRRTSLGFSGSFPTPGYLHGCAGGSEWADLHGTNQK